MKADFQLHMLECFLKDERVDLKAWDPMTRLLTYRIDIKGRGRSDALAIGKPASMMPTEQKRSVWDRLFHPQREP